MDKMRAANQAWTIWELADRFENWLIMPPRSNAKPQRGECVKVIAKPQNATAKARASVAQPFAGRRVKFVEATDGELKATKVEDRVSLADAVPNAASSSSDTNRIALTFIVYIKRTTPAPRKFFKLEILS